MRNIFILFATVLAVTTLGAGAAAERFVQKLKLTSGLTAVVAEGDFEARSIGSYSVRLYATGKVQPGDDTTFFVTGLLHQRDGVIERVGLHDIAGQGRVALVVMIRSAGSGGYRSAHAYAFDEKSLKLLAAVADLAPTADPIAALRKATMPPR